MPRIILRMPQQNETKEVRAERGANLLRTLQRAEIAIGSACGGHGLCASCKVIVLSGEHHLSLPTDTEIDLTARNRIPENERISCQCKISGDIEITTTYW